MPTPQPEAKKIHLLRKWFFLASGRGGGQKTGIMNIHHSSADIVRSGEKRCPAKMYWPLSLRGMGQISMIKAPNLWHKLCSTWSFWYDCGYKLWWVKIETLCTLFLASSWICTEPPTYQVDETAQLGQSTAISSHKVISETVKETKWWS